MSPVRRGGRRSSAARDLRSEARRAGRVANSVEQVSAQVMIASLGDRVDASTAYTCFARCIYGVPLHVVADLSATTFMNRDGYASLLSARAVIERRGGTFELVGAAGQPSRLLRAIAEEAADPGAPDGP